MTDNYQDFDLEQPDYDTVARLNDVDLDTVTFEDLEAEWTGRPRDNAGGESQRCCCNPSTLKSK